MTRAASFMVLVIALAACGDEDEVPSNIEPSAAYANRCESPRQGLDPETNAPFPDQKGSLLLEKLWVRSFINDYYLWYSEVEQIDPRPFPTVADYFGEMR